MAVDKKFRHVTTPMEEPYPNNLEDPNADGDFKSACNMWVGKLLYLSRMTRADLATAVGRLSRYMHKWNKYADHSLHRLMQYIDHHQDYQLVFTIEVGKRYVLRLYVDADHAGDISTSKSTTGAVLYIASEDESTWCPIIWWSKRQGATAWSSGEAELVALSEAVRPAIKLQLLSSAISGREMPMQVRDDSSACIGAVRKRYSEI